MEICDVYDKNDLNCFLINNNNGSNSYFKESYFKKIFPEFYKNIVEYHNKYYDEDFIFSQKIYNYIFDIKEIPHCPMCNNYVDFNTFKYGYAKYCSYKCAYSSSDRKKQISKTHKSKTGDEIKESNKKREETCLRKYNATCVLKSEYFKEKYAKIIANKSEEEKQQFRDKIRKTWNNKTKEELEIIKNKRKKTNALKTKEDWEKIYQKTIDTRVKKYGSLEEYYKISLNKIKRTNNERYGVDNFFQTDIVLNINQERWDKYRKETFIDVIEYVKESGVYICKCMDKNCNLCNVKIFSISVGNYLNRRNQGYNIEDICTIKNPIGEYRGKSKLQDNIYEYVKSIYDGEILYNDKHTLKTDCGKKIELDIYFPKINVAIEVNGDFWHMNPKIYKETDYNEKMGEYAKEIWERDIIKENVCKKLNIKLYTIWEYDWNTNKQDVKQKIKDILNIL